MALFGKKQEWEKWVSENLDSLLLYARSQARSEQDAEDILYKVLTQFWKKFSKVEEGHRRGVVCKKLRLASIDFYRSVERQKQRERKYNDFEVVDGSMAASENGWFDHFVDASDMQEVLLSELYSLPKQEQEIVILHIWNKLSFREIAEVVGVAKSTVCDRYSSTIKELKNQLEGKYKVCND